MSQIRTIEEYSDLAQAADVAEDALGSLRFGSHWLLIQKLSGYGVHVTDSKAAIKAARRLCDEFMQAYNHEG
jgi:thiamine monophosphate synthase